MKKFRLIAMLMALLLVLSSLTSCFRRPLINIEVGTGGGKNEIQKEDKKDTKEQKEEEDKTEEGDDCSHAESGGN